MGSHVPGNAGEARKGNTGECLGMPGEGGISIKYKFKYMIEVVDI
jgi:hypothetical protein